MIPTKQAFSSIATFMGGIPMRGAKELGVYPAHRGNL